MVFAAVAAVLAAAMPHFVGAAVDSSDPQVAGQHTAAFGAAGTVQPDPTEDGSMIIIECVVLGDHPMAIGLPGMAGMRLGSVPRQPLGPSKCWVGDKLLS
jgi:hypothetical protein